jgi:hypothetical protein
MRDESSERAALIRAGRTAFRPDPSDRERVLESLTRALGPGALVDGSRPAKLTRSVVPASSPVPAWVLGGMGVLAIGATVVAVAHPWTRTPSRAAVPVARSLPTAESAPSAPITPPPKAGDRTAERARAEGPSSTPRPMARSSIAPPPPDSLQEEVLVLSRAEQQLNSGHADEALRTLAEHERRFPDGALAEERMAARVQSLCALGRLVAAKAELAKFAQAFPLSPHLDRARRSCAFEAR